MFALGRPGPEQGGAQRHGDPAQDIFEYKEEPVTDDEGNPEYAADGTPLTETVTTRTSTMWPRS